MTRIFDENPELKTKLLRDIRRIFIEKDLNIIPVEILWFELLQLDSDIDWKKCKLTKRVIGNILSEFRIWSIIHRYFGDEPCKCWFREDFKDLWKHEGYK